VDGFFIHCTQKHRIVRKIIIGNPPLGMIIPRRENGHVIRFDNKTNARAVEKNQINNDNHKTKN